MVQGSVALMAIDPKKALLRLDRPPAGQNWARLVRNNTPRTTKALLQFLEAIIPFTYQTGTAAIRDEFFFGIGEATAIRVTQLGGAPAGRSQNKEFVQAFFEHHRVRRYPIGVSVEFERQWFRISRDVAVPVSPLAVIRENERFVPIFVCGWSDLALDLSQRRLLMTIIEDAFLSLTDYQDSPAEFLFFPRRITDDGSTKRRTAEVWKRGDYELLSQTDLDEHVQRFLNARDEVRQILEAEQRAEARRREEQRRLEEARKAEDPDDLFGK